MGRKSKVSDEVLLEILDKYKDVIRLQINVDKTYEKIQTLKKQASLARTEAVNIKKKIAHDYGISTAYVENIGRLIGRRIFLLEQKRKQIHDEIGSH